MPTRRRRAASRAPSPWPCSISARTRCAWSSMSAIARSLTPLYNEKSACALGRGVAQTGRLAYENIDRALTAIQRFALVARADAGRQGPYPRDLRRARRQPTPRRSSTPSKRSMGAKVEVLSGEAGGAFRGARRGRRHSRISPASSAISAAAASNCRRSRRAAMPTGETHELGVIRLQDDSAAARSPRRGEIARERLSQVGAAQGRARAAVLRHRRHLAVARQGAPGRCANYPLHMVQHYVDQGRAT